MGNIVQDFIGRVTDSYRGASPDTTAHVHGGGFQTSNATIARWIEDHPEVGQALAEVSSAVAALEGVHEGALAAFDRARERLLDARADEARLHHDARANGVAVDPEKAKRALTARTAATVSIDEAFARSGVASNGFARTRDELNANIKFVGTLAAERRSVSMASPVTLPKGVLADIIKAQRQTIADLDVEKSEIEAAPPPLEDAIAMLRASVVGKGPTIALTPRRVTWSAPKTYLNAAPRVGDAPVDHDDAVALLAWLLPDVLADKLEALARTRYAHVERTFTPADRIAALADVAARRTNAEAIEVAALRKAWAEGQYIPLRQNTTPAVLLGIAKVGEAAPDTSGAGSAFLGEVAR